MSSWRVAPIFAAAALVFGATPARTATSMVPALPMADVAVSADYTVSRVRYHDPLEALSIRREVYSLSFSYESFFATLGRMRATQIEEYEPFDFEESRGRIVALGGRGPVWEQGEFACLVHGQFHVMHDEIGDRVDVYREIKSRELLLGATFAWRPGVFQVYGGVETVPYSHITVSGPEGWDLEREDFFSALAGAGVNLRGLLLNLDGQFFGTRAIHFGIGAAF